VKNQKFTKTLKMLLKSKKNNTKFASKKVPSHRNKNAIFFLIENKNFSKIHKTVKKLLAKT
jgi:predicted cupin superfamily sugar epimerase